MVLHELSTLKSRFVSREVGNELILVPLTGSIAQMSEMFTLNATARFIWENISNDITEDKMVDLMTDYFEIDRETALKDVQNFSVKLSELLIKK